MRAPTQIFFRAAQGTYRVEHRRRGLSNHGSRHKAFYVPECIAADRKTWIVRLGPALVETVKQLSETSDGTGAVERSCLLSIFRLESASLDLFRTYECNHTSLLHTRINKNEYER